MENTYKFVHHDKPLSAAEIRQTYKGNWIFIVNATFNDRNGVVSGIPVIIGSIPYAGASEGIYKKYRADEYGETVDMNLLPNKTLLSILKSEGDGF